MRERIVALDTLRGFASLGILAVNALIFSTIFPLAFASKGGAFTGSAVSLTLWWIVETFFVSKFIGLFSMLFGVSCFLVGGEVGDRQRSRFLRRRLAWMAVFGLAHGVLIWFGEVMFDYALCGIVIYLVRSWPARRLIWAGVITALTFTIGIEVWSYGLDRGWFPDLVTLGPPVKPNFGGTFAQSFTANALTRINYEPLLSLLTVEFTLPVMLLGLGVFKAGLFTGDLSAATYRRLILAGLAGLVATGAVFGLSLSYPKLFPGEALHLTQDLAAPLISLAYASLIILTLRGGNRWLSTWLAPVGRMAFSNYIAQSLIMTAIFYGGRGPGLFGKMDRPQLALIVVTIWVLQILVSRLVMAQFGTGPLEWLWRRLTYGTAPR